MFNKTLLTLAGAAILASNEASAYTLIQCGTTPVKWASSFYDVHVESTGFPPGSPYRDALAWVENKWYTQSSNLWYGFTYDDPDWSTPGKSTVTWATPFGTGGAPAVALMWWDDACQFTEVDILFNQEEAYTYSTTKKDLWPYGGASRPFQTTAMHEFGHAGGLDHTANRYNIMGQDWTHIHANGSTAAAYIGEDATAGLVAVYGLWANAYEDLGVVHWRWTGSSGGYSTHDRTRLLNCSTGKPLATYTTTPEPVYKVNKGQCVKLELTYENMGKTNPLSTKVGYYVSTDDTITTLDTFLSTKSFTLYRDTVDTETKRLTIPSNLSSGKNYWVGAIVDYTNAIAEIDEVNNATYVGIRVN